MSSNCETIASDGGKVATKGGTVVRVADLVKVYDGRAVLDRISLDIRAGETVVIMGGSGCGKSTLLRLMIGTMTPDGGRVELFGHDLGLMDEGELEATRKRFGVLFQSAALLNSMTVGENVALPLREHTDLDDETIEIMVRIKLELVGMRDAVALMPSEISGGMKKRAGLARAIALDPEVLFYDEPSAGLDPVTSAEIDQLMIDLSSKLGTTSVVVTHEMDSAFRLADRMALLEGGRLLKVAPRSEFQAIRDGPETGDATTNLIRQFLLGQCSDLASRKRQAERYQTDIMGAAGG